MIRTPAPFSLATRILLTVIAVVALQGATPDPGIQSLSLVADFALPIRLSPQDRDLGRRLLAGLGGTFLSQAGEAFSFLHPPSVAGSNDAGSPKAFHVVAVRRSGPGLELPWPVRGGISSGFGMRRHPITRRSSFHAGIDILAFSGTPIVSPMDGLITNVCRAGAMGRLVKIRARNGLTLYFGHLSAFRCRRGQRVTKGQVVGLVGSSGRTTGPHLHFSIARAGRYLNPLVFLAPR